MSDMTTSCKLFLGWKELQQLSTQISIQETPLSEVSLSSVSVTHGQLQFKNFKWKILERNNSCYPEQRDEISSCLAPSRPGHECPSVQRVSTVHIAQDVLRDHIHITFIRVYTRPLNNVEVRGPPPPMQKSTYNLTPQKLNYVCPLVSEGLGSRTLHGTKSCRCSSLLYKIVQNNGQSWPSPSLYSQQQIKIYCF